MIAVPSFIRKAASIRELVLAVCIPVLSFALLAVRSLLVDLHSLAKCSVLVATTIL
jgi:hypothetical protein